MGALEILQSHVLRHCYKYQPSQISSLVRSTSSLSLSLFKDLKFSNSHSRFQFLGFPRLLSSSPDSPSDTPTDDSIKTRPSSPSIKPVSYAVKPEAPSIADEEIPPSSEPPTSQTLQVSGRSPFRRAEADSGTSPDAAESRPWTREDFRYVKNVPSIAPVSYPTRVAPLPDDKVSSVIKEEENVEGEGDRKETGQLERERRKIEAEFGIRRGIRVEEEKAPPFPTIIKVEKKKQKVVLDLQEAIREVKANAKWKCIETVEAHVNLGVDPRRGDQMVRGATTLPHGTGKIVRVAVFAEGAAAGEASAAGADIVGGDELIEEIKKGGGKLNFDKCISTPTFMPRLGKIARILGPRGLMPNPKLGSVTSDVAVAVKEAKCGRIDFKIDKTAIVHVGLGKVNFSEDALRENVGAFVNALLLSKPVGLKKTSKYAGYVNAFTLSSTMGPGFPVSIQSLSMAADHYNKMQQLK